MALPQEHSNPEDGGDGVDRISGLPEELLLQVLVRLGCAREAARTADLASRWRGLSKLLPEYTFRGVAPESVEAALEQVTRLNLDRLHIWAAVTPEEASVRASSLLLAAARLEPEELSLTAAPTQTTFGVAAAEAIELPSLDRTRSLDLFLPVPFTLPATGAFARLESLSVTTLHAIPDAQLSSCPRLRVLRVIFVRPLEVVTVHSTTLEELELFALNVERGVLVEAPLLKAAELTIGKHRKVSLSFSAPKVEKLHWTFGYKDRYVVGLHDLLFLGDIEYSLSLGTRTLLLRIDSLIYGHVERSLVQEIARLQVADFSVLRLVIKSGGHAFGPLLLHLLQIRPVIRRLEMELNQGEPEDMEECPQDCPCLQPVDWKNENISLNDLKEVTISYSFEIGDEELDFLKLLFRCAPTLKRMKVGGLAGEGFNKVQKICEAKPHVECDVSSCSHMENFVAL